jgi:hypothetical protein
MQLCECADSFQKARGRIGAHCGSSPSSARLINLRKFCSVLASRTELPHYSRAASGHLVWVAFRRHKIAVHRNFQCPSEFFERFQCGNCVAVLNTRNVDTDKPCALLDVAVGQILLFTQSFQAIANDQLERIRPQSAPTICVARKFR